MLNEETGKLEMLKVADDVLKKAILELEGVHHELVRVDGSVIPITAKILKEQLRIAMGYIKGKGHDSNCSLGRSDVPEMEPDPCSCGLDEVLFEIENIENENK